jgi:glycerophosphoryl diester phosphodiesterase
VSNGVGLVNKMSLRKLKKYNFGSKMYPCKICTLEEFLKCINTNKIILIELKFESSNYKEFVDIVFNIIKKYKLNIYICSFNYELLKYFHTKYKKCGLLIGNLLNTSKLYNDFYFNIVSYNYRKIISKKETFLWTINEYKNDLSKFYIITDTPYIFKKNKST